MKKTVLAYGLISGGVAAGLMLATVPFADSLNGRRGEIVGYTGIALSALLVFFGIRSYRDNVGDGRITFGRGLAVGCLITLIMSVFYVATWELVYFKLAPELGDKMFASHVERVRASGAPEHEVLEAMRQAQSFKKLYDNPLANAAITFIEPLPVGLLVTAVSALILRRR